MTEALLQTRAICKSFGALEASKDVTLDLHNGEIHALIGPNGAGKSTLIAQISGALRPDSGQVIFDGQDVTALTTTERARLGLGRTFQISALPMEFTVLQNVVLGALGQRGRAFRFFRNVMRDKALLEQAEDWRDLPRLSVSGPRPSWRNWREFTGQPTTSPTALRYDTFASALSAARAGLGVLLGSLPLCQADLENGTLMQVSTAVMPHHESYWLLASKERISRRQWEVLRASLTK